jgi:hypothetical protein
VKKPVSKFAFQMQPAALHFGGLDPFPNHKKLCQCAHGVDLDVFAPFRLPEDDASAAGGGGSNDGGDLDDDGEVEPSPQIMLENPAHKAGLYKLNPVDPYSYSLRNTPGDPTLD